MKTRFAKVGVEKLKCPAKSLDLKPTEHLWDVCDWKPLAVNTNPAIVLLVLLVDPELLKIIII